MENKYKETWFFMANVFGAAKNVCFFAVCYYEYGIVLRLFDSAVIAYILPFVLESTQYFFSKFGALQFVFDLQQAKARAVEKYLTSAKMGFGFEETEEKAKVREKYIDYKGYEILKKEIIPSSGLPSWLVYSLSAMVCLFIICFVTFNRVASNQKQLDSEILASNRNIEESFRYEQDQQQQMSDAKIAVIISEGSVSSEGIDRLKEQIAEKNSELSKLDKSAVLAAERLRGERAKLNEQLQKKPLGSQAQLQKNREIENLKFWAINRKREIEQDKHYASSSIHQKYALNDSRISYVAIGSCIFYVIFAMIGTLMSTLAQKKGFDLIETFFDLINFAFSKMMLWATTKPEEVKVNVEEKGNSPVTEQKEDVEIPVEKPTEKAEKVEVKIVELPKRVEPKPLSQKPKPKSIIPIKAFKKAQLKAYIESGNKILDGKTVDAVWSCIANGRRCLIEGRTGSDQIVKMNVLLEHLETVHGIIVNPDQTEVKTMTPDLWIKNYDNINFKQK